MKKEVYVMCKLSNNFLISNYGNVKKRIRGNWKKLIPSKRHAYYIIMIEGLRMPIHRLVAMHFLKSAPFGKFLVRHLDDNTSNNHVSNLAWGDSRDNTLDAMKNGKFSTRKVTHPPNGKLDMRVKNKVPKNKPKIPLDIEKYDSFP